MNQYMRQVEIDVGIKTDEERIAAVVGAARHKMHQMEDAVDLGLAR